MVIGYYPAFVIQHHAAALREYHLVAVVGIDRYHGIIYFFVNLFGILGGAVKSEEWKVRRTVRRNRDFIFLYFIEGKITKNILNYFT